jgi:hypothetical protein
VGLPLPCQAPSLALACRVLFSHSRIARLDAAAQGCAGALSATDRVSFFRDRLRPVFLFAAIGLGRISSIAANSDENAHMPLWIKVIGALTIVSGAFFATLFILNLLGK